MPRIKIDAAATATPSTPWIIWMIPGIIYMKRDGAETARHRKQLLKISWLGLIPSIKIYTKAQYIHLMPITS
jgi:hypothetical protein